MECTVSDEPEKLFIVLHEPPQSGRIKVIGIYSSAPLAEAAVQEARLLPGFNSDPDAFFIRRYALNQSQWHRGFVRL